MPAAKIWFDQKKSERKSDPLLSYLRHARNAAEHTLNNGANKAEISVSGRATDADGFLGFSVGPDGQMIPSFDGMTDVRIHKNEIMLNAAIDRGVAYRPPEEHLGAQINGDTAREVACLALEHMENLVNEAVRFAIK